MCATLAGGAIMMGPRVVRAFLVAIPAMLSGMYGASREVFVLSSTEAVRIREQLWRRVRRVGLRTGEGEPVPIRTRGSAILVIGGAVSKTLPDGSRRVPRVEFVGLADAKAVCKIAVAAQQRLLSSRGAV